MIEYTKIETPFERDMKGTKKLIEGKWRNPFIEFLKDCQWECTEKIDGTNIGVVWDGHKVSFQGRTEKAVIPKGVQEFLDKTFGGIENEELFEQMFGEEQVILFGEGYGNKIQKVGSEYREDNSFILFDVYKVEKDMWLDRSAVNSIATAFGIDNVPVIMTSNLQEAIDYVKTKPQSTIGTAPMEGLVCRPKLDIRDSRGNRTIVKIKVCDFE